MRRIPFRRLSYRRRGRRQLRLRGGLLVRRCCALYRLRRGSLGLGCLGRARSIPIALDIVRNDNGVPDLGSSKQLSSF